MLQELLHRNGGKEAPHHSPNTPFHKQLRWLVQNPPAHSVVMEIGPKEAQEMLRYNVDEEGNGLNRPLSKGHVSHGIARQMKEGMWLHTGQPIIFSDRPRLIDGQHRLEGIVESGVKLLFDVRFGISDGAFSVIDIGKKRGAADIFAINGVKNSALMAAATRWVIAYEHDAISGKGPDGKRGTMKTPGELYEVYLDHQGLQASCTAANHFHSARTAPPAMMCALHYLCAQKNRQQADIFFDMVGTGFGFPTKTCPAWRLHRRLIDNLTGSEHIDYPTMAAYTVKAWNATRRNQPVGALKWTASSEKFPRII